MFNVSYRLFDKNGRRISKEKVAQARRFDIVVNNKKAESIEFPSSYKKADKQNEIVFFTGLIEDELFKIEEEKKETAKEKNRKKREQARLAREEDNRLNEERTRYKREQARLAREEEKRIKEEKDFQKFFEKELKRLIKKDEVEEETAIKQEKEILHTPEEEAIRKEARKIIRKEETRLKKSIQGRLRLFVMEELNERFIFWEAEKIEAFVEEMEKAYSVDTKSLKERANETNFKRFLSKQLKVLRYHDVFKRYTEGEQLRNLVKRLEFETDMEDQEKSDIVLEDDDINYYFVNESNSFYYSKTFLRSQLTRQFNFKFDPQLEVTNSVGSKLTVKTLAKIKEITQSEAMDLFSRGIIKNGDMVQIRLIVPQYDENGNIVNNYIGGNGEATGSRDENDKVVEGKYGYGISAKAKEFTVKDIEIHAEELIVLTEERLRNYLVRNSGFINSQFVSGFSISVGKK